MEKEEFMIRPIEYVRVEGDNPKDADYYIYIDKQYRSALKELDQFNHAMVFWWAHENDKEEIRNQSKLSIVPPYGEDPPERGVFPTRAEYRPNPIALTTTSIAVDVEKGVVTIAGIDAFNGTPVVDLKAYFPFDEYE